MTELKTPLRAVHGNLGARILDTDKLAFDFDGAKEIARRCNAFHELVEFAELMAAPDRVTVPMWVREQDRNALALYYRDAK